MGRMGADTGLEGRCCGPLEKNPLEGLPEPEGLSTCRDGQTGGVTRGSGTQTAALPMPIATVCVPPQVLGHRAAPGSPA